MGLGAIKCQRGQAWPRRFTGWTLQGVFTVLAMVMLLVAWAPARGQSEFVDGGCAAFCHGAPPSLPNASATYGKIIPQVGSTHLNDANSCASNSSCELRLLIRNNPSMGLGFESGVTNAQMEAIRVYLRQVRDGVVTGNPPFFAQTPAGTSSVGSSTLTVVNRRGVPITWRLSTTGPFSITSTTSGTCAAATETTLVQSCSVPVTVRFNAPTTPGTTSGSLTVTLTDSQAANPSLSPRTLSLSAVSAALNQPPTARAGSPQNVSTGSTVTIDGSASSDPEGAALTYAWSLTSRPAGSAAALTAGSTPAQRQFVADVAGTYAASLSVSDAQGLASTSASTVQITASTANRPPVAVATGPGVVDRGATANLDGRSSSDPDGTSLAFTWSFSSRPAGSTATLSGASSSQPSFVADVAGAYDVLLNVSDGALSASSTVRVNVNAPPSANAGSPQNAVVGTPVSLDGRGSSDPEGSALTYTWSLSRPAGSAASLSSTTSATPSFTPDVAGAYTATLTVSDGRVSSGASLVTINAAVGNVAPVANLGASRSVTPGTLVTLDGSASTDGNNDPLTYAWSLTSRPAGSAAVLTSTTAARVSFTADVAGPYGVSLVVNDGTVSSAPSSITITAVNQPGSLSANTSTLSFTSVVGASGTASAVLSNNGGSPLTLSTLSLAGANAGDFSVVSGGAAPNACVAGSVVAASGSCVLEVRFAPAVAGSREATLDVAHSGAGSPLTLTLRGTGTATAAPRLELSALSLDFGASNLGAAVVRTVNLRNAGDASLNLSGLSLSGAAAADYSVAPSAVGAALPGCTVGTPVPAGASCELTLSFTASSLGARSATLDVASDASNGSATLALVGQGTSLPTPQLQVQPPSVDFGNRTVGGAYQPVTVRLTNTGVGELALRTTAVVGDAFSVVNSTCTSSLASGTSCELSLQFTPTAAGVESRQALRVDSNATSTPLDVPLVGRGVALVSPVLVWGGLNSAPPTLAGVDFGEVSVGTLSGVRRITLTNQGPGAVQISLVNVVGAQSSQFAVSQSDGACVAGASLFEGQSCDVLVQFAPSAAGARQAQLQLLSSGASPGLVPLRGSGLGGPAPTVSLSTTSLDFAAVRVGASSVPTEVVLRNAGSTALQVSALEVTGPFLVQGLTCPSTLPFTLAPGSQCTLAVSYKPTSSGSEQGQLRITSNASPSQSQVALQGTAMAPAEVSAGGCSMVDPSLRRGFDPTFVLMTLIALGLLWRRARKGHR
jgi:trimeric autotransporter adhesin